MADKPEPVWIPLLSGGLILLAWTALVAIIAISAVHLTSFSVASTITLAVVIWLPVALTVSKLVLADLRGDPNGQ